MHWYNNGIQEKKCSDENIPDGWVCGRLPKSEESKQKLKETLKKNNSNKNRHWYHNDNGDVIFCHENEVPDGFIKGVSDAQKVHLQEISGNQKGISKSDDARKNMSKGAKKRLANKENHPLYGKHHSKETITKISNANKGKISPFKGVPFTEEQKEARIQHIINEYGSVENFDTIRLEKAKKTKLEKYGDENYINVDKIKETIEKDPTFYQRRKEKTQKTIKEKYGDTKKYFKSKLPTIIKNAGFDCEETYWEYWKQLISQNRSSNSKLEDRCEQFLIVNNINYQKEYFTSDKNISHKFDFAIFSEEKLVSLVDVDGLYYHGFLNDFDGKTINNYSDDYRPLLVPEGVKFILIIEHNEVEGYAQIIESLTNTYEDYLQDIFNWCREEEFPYPKYEDKVLLKSFKSLLNSDCNKFSMNARYGEKLINHFYTSIWSAHKYGKLSPEEAWENDEMLKHCIKNRIIYKGTSLDKSRVLAGFTISGIAPKVSIFNPYLAKYLVNKYLSNYSCIFDPCSGFGGRLLGTISLNKTYIGQDINNAVVEESQKMLQFLGEFPAKLYCKDSLKTTGSYECLFTCPPYEDKEIWQKDFTNHYTCDEWIDKCLSNYKCKTYLFVVDNTEKYKDYIVETLTNKSHFGNNQEYVIKIESLEN